MPQLVERVQTAREPGMRRILVVDDDPPYLPRYSRMAQTVWIQGIGRRRRYQRSPGSGQFDVRSHDRRHFHAAHARLRVDQDVSRPRAHGPLIAISGYAFSGLEASSPDFLRMALRLGATRCLRKPFRPTTLLSVIDQCLSEAEPHRRYVATLAGIADGVAEPQGKAKSSLQEVLAS